PANSIIDTQSNDAALVTVQAPMGYAVTWINVYECDVPTGTVFNEAEFPPFSEFAFVGAFQSGESYSIVSTAPGNSPPTTNGTGTAGNIQQDTLEGGPNGTQGLRWAVIAFQDMFDTVSGIQQAAAFSYNVDVNGYEIGVFNLPTGPTNYIQNVIVGFGVADGLSAGPFF